MHKAHVVFLLVAALNSLLDDQTACEAQEQVGGLPSLRYAKVNGNAVT
jgi:hypothetical protein